MKGFQPTFQTAPPIIMFLPSVPEIAMRRDALLFAVFEVFGVCSDFILSG